MAIGENPLDGLDLSVLDNITPEPKAEEKATEEKTEDPGIFNPELKIQEVDEIPTKIEEKDDQFIGEDTGQVKTDKEKVKTDTADTTKADAPKDVEAET